MTGAEPDAEGAGGEEWLNSYMITVAWPQSKASEPWPLLLQMLCLPDWANISFSVFLTTDERRAAQIAGCSHTHYALCFCLMTWLAIMPHLKKLIMSFPIKHWTGASGRACFSVYAEISESSIFCQVDYGGHWCLRPVIRISCNNLHSSNANFNNSAILQPLWLLTWQSESQSHI